LPFLQRERMCIQRRGRGTMSLKGEESAKKLSSREGIRNGVVGRSAGNILGEGRNRTTSKREDRITNRGKKLGILQGRERKSILAERGTLRR